MKATSRDVVVTALLIALAGTSAFISAVLVQMESTTHKAIFDILIGLGLMAWLYSGIAALEVADRRTLWQIATAAIFCLPVVTVVISLA